MVGRGMRPTFCASQLHTPTLTCCTGIDDTMGDCTRLVTGMDATDAPTIGDATGRIIGEEPIEV